MNRFKKTPLQGTIFFLNLPEETAAVIKNVEIIICEKEALISDFLYKKVTHIIVDRKKRRNLHIKLGNYIHLPLDRHKWFK